MTHRHKPSAAVDAVLIFSGSNSGLDVYLARICLIAADAILSFKTKTKTIRVRLHGCQYKTSCGENYSI